MFCKSNVEYFLVNRHGDSIHGTVCLDFASPTVDDVLLYLRHCGVPVHQYRVVDIFVDNVVPF